ncbi:conserved hypothetical protein [Talaromyces stipitatus ATCC 10500]|uniref:Amidohydrolase-related domain-containing protein n=1 Tax=Talaromyces stipitatus (strain ATCC 10500 / CBS 375.48 / QM 6759 / NRRL 1006) TaxID=441959 RepID=B8LVA1_TALSN|nr:uncharacterized protein TSTA_066040 [Talaromyces stipitatus ATCC 10500]EED23151.1 conserved hypothetical protein [Talaromyces stipitatus ATCC 10500]
MDTTTFLITDVQIFTGKFAIPCGYVYVVEGKIADYGCVPAPEKLLESQSAIKKLSMPDHKLLPGLIDAHMHADGGNELSLEQSLRFGVTTVLDLHNEPENMAKLKRLAAQNKNFSDFKCASLAAMISGGWPEAVMPRISQSPEAIAKVASWPKISSPSEASKFVDDRISEGADYVKLMHESGGSMGFEVKLPSIELQKALVSAAHDHTMEILNAGVDGMAHTFCDKAITPELVQAYKTNSAWCSPTLVTIGSLTKQDRSIAERFAHDHRVQNLLDPSSKRNMCMCMGFGHETASVEYAYESVRQLKQAGIDILWLIILIQAHPLGLPGVSRNTMRCSCW